MPVACFPNADVLDSITQQSESGGNPFAVSRAGARGLMQVMPSTSRDPGYGVSPSNGTAADDVRVGKQYRAALLNKYGDLSAMWAAYNHGPGNVNSLMERYGSDWLSHAPKETRDYVRKNLNALRNN